MELKLWKEEVTRLIYCGTPPNKTFVQKCGKRWELPKFVKFASFVLASALDLHQLPNLLQFGFTCWKQLCWHAACHSLAASAPRGLVCLTLGSSCPSTSIFGTPAWRWKRKQDEAGTDAHGHFHPLWPWAMLVP